MYGNPKSDAIDYDEVRRLANRILSGDTFDVLVEEGRIQNQTQADCFALASQNPEYWSQYFPDAEVGAATISDELWEHFQRVLGL